MDELRRIRPISVVGILPILWSELDSHGRVEVNPATLC